MKKRVLALSLLLIMLLSTTAYAYSGYMGESITVKNQISSSSSIGKNTSGTARVDINTLSDTADCRYVKVFIMNTQNGSITTTQNMYAQNTKFFSVNTGKIKAVYKRGSTTSGTTNLGTNFIYNY